MLDSAVAHRRVHRGLGDAIRRRASASSHADRDDLHQAASLRVVLRLRSSPGTDVTPSYLHRVARNAIVDAQRQRTARRRRDLDAATLAPGPGPTPEDMVMNAELAGMLSEHLHRLPAARRDAVARYIRGERVCEIAAATGENAKRIENLVYRGLQALRRSLTEAGLRP